MLLSDILLSAFSILLLICLFLIQMEKKSSVRKLALSHSERKWRSVVVGAHLCFAITNLIFICTLTKHPFSLVEIRAPLFFHGFVHSISLQAVAGLFNLMMLLLIVRVYEISRLRKKIGK